MGLRDKERRDGDKGKSGRKMSRKRRKAILFCPCLASLSHAT